MFLNLLLVGSGGFLGSILRYGLSGLAQRLVPAAAGFPLGTLVVNVLGCFAIGAVYGLMETRQVFGPETRLFLLIGVLGGFTTFSTFGYETFAMLQDGGHLKALASVLLHVVLGLVAVWLGHAAGLLF